MKMTGVKKVSAGLVLVLLIAVTVFATMAFAGCGGGEYTFEAEDAALGEGTEVRGESGATYNTETGVADGPEAKWVSYFGSADDGATAVEESLIWEITANKACTATVTLVAATNPDFATMDWATFQFTQTTTVEMTDNAVFYLTNNDKAVTWNADSSTLGGVELTNGGSFSDPWVYRVFTEVTGTVELEKGVNKFVLTSNGAGVNVDKLIIDSEASLEFTPADNGIEFPEDGTDGTDGTV